MRKNLLLTCGVCLLTGLFLIGFMGCSQDASNQSSSAVTAPTLNNDVEMVSPPATRIQFVAELASIDLDTRTLTFVDHEEVVIADEDCIVVAIVAGVEEPITLADLVVGDMVKVCGCLQEDGSVLANKLVVYSGCDFSQYDLAFRDTIISVDYEGGSFMVANRVETILVDENTAIWTVIPEMNRGDGGGDDYGDPGIGSEIGDGPDVPKRERRAYYEFSALMVNDVVEVKAIIIDENTLLAVSVKLANSVYRQCSEFDATLADVNYVDRLVTFAENDYTGYVCPGAELYAADATVLTLEDFAAGDAVHVKGFEMDDGTFKVCVMSKL